jgi:hypothetical protein
MISITSEDFPPPLFSLRHATRCFSAQPPGLDLNRASPWFNSSMGRGYARGVTRHKQAEKSDMTGFPRGKSEALVPRY